MSTLKEIERTIEKINTWMETACSKFKIEFHKGSTINGVTHKIFKVYPDNIIELVREKHTKDLLKWLEGYFQGFKDHVRTFKQ